MTATPYVPGTNRTGRPWQRVKRRVIRRDDGVCWLCGKPGADTADHVIPVSRGGPIYDPLNLRACHIKCNRVRGNRPPHIAQAELRDEAPSEKPGYRDPNGAWNPTSRRW
jgi:5-methylcytosine-specific restriction endonuclease McrA